jgi:hypothetical protein
MLLLESGRSRTRFPVAAKIALQNAATNGGTLSALLEKHFTSRMHLKPRVNAGRILDAMLGSDEKAKYL